MISVLNFKPFDRGALKGFFDLRYHGLTIKGCRLMLGNKGLWFALPQHKGEQDGETKHFDQLYLTPPEAEHVRKLALADLQSQGHIEAPTSKNNRKPGQQHSTHQTPEGLDLSTIPATSGAGIGVGLQSKT